MKADRVDGPAQKSVTARDGARQGAPQAAARPAAVRPAEARQARMGQAFSQIVAVLMRDPNFRNLKIADLEWLVIPPVMAGQFRLAHAQTQTQRTGAKEPQAGAFVPVAMALWARVSPVLDKGLSDNLDKRVRLRPNDWASGDKIWLMAAAGDPRAVPTFLKQLEEAEFKGQEVKMRARGSDGKGEIRTLAQHVKALIQQATKAAKT